MGEEHRDNEMPIVLRYTKKDRVFQLILALLGILFVGLFALLMMWCCFKLVLTTMPEREPTQEQIELIQKQNREILDMLGGLKEETQNEEGTEN